MSFPGKPRGPLLLDVNVFTFQFVQKECLFFLLLLVFLIEFPIFTVLLFLVVGFYFCGSGYSYYVGITFFEALGHVQYIRNGRARFQMLLFRQQLDWSVILYLFFFFVFVYT